MEQHDSRNDTWDTPTNGIQLKVHENLKNILKHIIKDTHGQIMYGPEFLNAFIPGGTLMQTQSRGKLRIKKQFC